MKYTRQFAAPLALAAALFVGACAKKDDTAATGDSALNRDLAMAGRDTAAQPALQDVPAAGTAAAPAATTPAPAAATPAPATSTKSTTTKSTTTTKTSAPASSSTTKTGGTSAGGTTAAARPSVASGTQLTFANAGETVCTDTKNVGDEFTMSLESPVGAATTGTARFRVTESKPAHNSSERPVLSLSLVSMTLNGVTHSGGGSVDANVKTMDASNSDDAKKVAAGAAVGAIAGRVLGKSTKATIGGAAAGAAAGAAVAAKTGDRKGCLTNAVVTLTSNFSM